MCVYICEHALTLICLNAFLSIKKQRIPKILTKVLPCCLQQSFSKIVNTVFQKTVPEN